MPNEIVLDLTQVDAEIRDMLSTYTPGQRGKATIEFMTKESGDEVFSASIEGVSDMSTPELSEEETERIDGSDATEDLPPPALVVISKNRGEASES